ncbi:MAG: hypothetical protein M1831_007153 [Alyxoria varia]|nr:MAG: hypothetical protein M1831_007153 [Alyxoria varia]
MSASAAADVTAQMATTTINEPNPSAEGATVGAGGDKPINAAQNEAVIQSAAEGRRLYIGNLAYATSEGDLKEFFKEFLVETTSIPTNPRTTRPVGYAFVDLSTPSEAERAVQELNGKTVLDRKVSVQLARKPDEGTDGEGISKKSSQRKRSSGRGRGRGGRRGGRSGRTTRDPKEDGAEGEANGAPTNVPGQVEPLADATNKQLTNGKGEEGADGSSNNKPKAQRSPRQRGPPEDGVPSKTKIMVANLPYDLREEKLLEIFKDYEATGAKLALRPIPRFMVRKLQARNEPRKGRGFAFVTLATEEQQTKAIAEMNGKEVEGRELAVKVAIDSPGKEDDSLNGAADSAEAKENKENAAPSTAEASGSVPDGVPAPTAA